MSQKREFAALLACAVLVFSTAVFLRMNTLDFPFAGDDYPLIVNNDLAGSDIKENIRLIFSLENLQMAYPMVNGARPLTLVSLMLDHRLWGLRARGFRFTNIVLHGVNSALVFLFVSSVLSLAGARAGTAEAFGSAFFAALIFMLHPLQSEVVNIPGNRANLLCFAFYMVSLLFFIKAFATVNFAERWSAAAAGAATFVLALFSKEIAVTLPVLLAGLSLIIRPSRADRPGPAHALRYAALALPLVAVSAGFLYYFWLSRVNYSLYSVFFVNLGRGLSPVTSITVYLNTIAAALLHYVKAVFFPVDLSFEYQLFIPGGLLSFRNIAATAVLLFPFIVFLKSRDTAVRFLVFFILITYSPASNIFPLVNSVSDRYMYFPVAGFSALAAMTAFRMPQLPAFLGRFRAVPAYLLVIPAVFFYNNKTEEWNSTFRSLVSLYGDAVKKAPENPRARYNLGAAYVSSGNYGAALDQFSRLAVISPLFKRSETWEMKGVCFESLGRLEDARSAYTKAILTKPSKNLFQRLSTVLWRGKELDAAERVARKGAELFSDPVLYNNLGTALAVRNKYSAAESAYRTAIGLRPEFTDPWFNLMGLYEKTGRKEKAEIEAEKMAKLYAQNGWGLGRRSSYVQ